MVNAVAYCRVSTNKSDQINSFEAQKEFFTEYAKEYNYNLVCIYADEGITGTSRKNRAEFNKMMEDCEKGQFSVVLVKDISRFARNTVDLLEGIRKLRANDINVKFITAGMDTIDGNEFTLTIFGAMAQEESANMSKRIKFGKKVNAEKGKVPNMCYGYIKNKGDWFNLQINETEAKVVREIFDLYANQGYGAHKISKILNERGLISSRGVPWSTTAISRLLKNKLYAGFVVNGKTEVKDFIEKTRRIKDESEWIEIERPEMRIIPLELWKKAQKVNEENNGELGDTLHKKRSNRHLFSTLITCPVCKYSFRRIARKNETDLSKIRWSCSGRNHNGTDSCHNRTNIPESELIANIDAFFKSLISDKQKFITKIIEEFEKNSPVSESAVLISELEKLEIKKKKQIEMFEADIISIDELKIRTADIDKQIAKIKLEIDHTETTFDIEKKSKELYKRLTDNFNKYSSVLNMTNAELKTLIKCIVADENGNIRIELNY